MKKNSLAFIAVGSLMCLSLLVNAATKKNNKYAIEPDKVYTFKAQLVDPEANSARGTAVVQVQEVTGVILESPLNNSAMRSNSDSSKKNPPVGHLHYQLDNGAVLATGSAQLVLHALDSGSHTVTVTLADKNEVPLAQEQLSFIVP